MARRLTAAQSALVSAGATGDAGNLFAGAKVTASGHYGNDRPELAVDGQANNAGKYWGCEGIPVWLQIDMGKPRALSALHVWPYWEGGRIYKYKIEGSEDGKNWKMLADQSSNSIAATSEGVPFKFNPQTVRYVKITFLGNNAGNDKGGPRAATAKAKAAQAPMARTARKRKKAAGGRCYWAPCWPSL